MGAARVTRIVSNPDGAITVGSVRQLIESYCIITGYRTIVRTTAASSIGDCSCFV